MSESSVVEDVCDVWRLTLIARLLLMLLLLLFRMMLTTHRCTALFLPQFTFADYCCCTGVRGGAVDNGDVSAKDEDGMSASKDVRTLLCPFSFLPSYFICPSVRGCLWKRMMMKRIVQNANLLLCCVCWLKEMNQIKRG